MRMTIAALMLPLAACAHPEKHTLRIAPPAEIAAVCGAGAMGCVTADGAAVAEDPCGRPDTYAASLCWILRRAP